jgi:hypothetical protein
MEEADRVMIPAVATLPLALAALKLLQDKGLASADEIVKAVEGATAGIEDMKLPPRVVVGARAFLRELLPLFHDRAKSR